MDFPGVTFVLISARRSVPSSINDVAVMIPLELIFPELIFPEVIVATDILGVPVKPVAFPLNVVADNELVFAL